MNNHKYLVIITSSIWIVWANIAQAAPVNPKIIHLLNRLSLGIRPGEIEQVQQLGVDKYIQQQLNPETISEPAILTEKLAQLETIALSPNELFQQYNPNRKLDAQSPLPPLKKISRTKQDKLLTKQSKRDYGDRFIANDSSK